MTPLESIYAHPEDWVCNKHSFIHKDGFSIWIANGASSCSPESGGQFNSRDKKKYWKAFCWWRQSAPIESYKAAI